MGIEAPDLNPSKARHTPGITVRPTYPVGEVPPPPPEPAPWTASAQEWDIWVRSRDEYNSFVDKKNKANDFAAENDLRGVPFS